MLHVPELIKDLALLLTVAGAGAILFKFLKQPVVLGYVLAGVLVGPHVHFLPTVTDVTNIKIWADIGVIFVLFGLGLEFSFKKLLRIGGAASVTAIVEVGLMVLMGFLIGQFLGWGDIDSLFLGGVIAISSTMTILRLLEDAKLKKRGFAGLVLGVLVVEDLVAVLLMVLLTTVAISKQLQGQEMLVSVLKLVFFLTLWLFSGISFIPTIIRKFKPHLTAETLLVVSLALCFLMVVISAQAGFSAALGAFIMGSILAETSEAHAIEKIIEPIKHLFAAVFFVSVGVLVDPRIIISNFWIILVVTGVVIVGKSLGSIIGGLLAGQKLRHCIQTGFTLTQVGEFSFIIAGLGQSLNVTNEALYPIAMGSSVLTMFISPYLFQWSDPANRIFERVLPARFLKGIERYHLALQRVSVTVEWKEELKRFLTRVIVNSVFIIAIFVLIEKYLARRWTGDQGYLVEVLAFVTGLILSLPFLWALAIGNPHRKGIKEIRNSPMAHLPLLVLDLSRICIALGIVSFFLLSFFPPTSALIFALGVLILSGLIFSKQLQTAHHWLEKMFLENIADKQDHKEKVPMPALAPWDAQILEMEMSADSHFVGKTLEEAKIREQYGITIALISRGSQRITAPNRYERLFPNDKLAVIGTEEQILEFSKAIERTREKPVVAMEYVLQPLIIDRNSPFLGRTIRDSGLREQTQGLVVGIERAGQRILNPDSSITIQEKDLLWVVGDRKYLDQIVNTLL